MNLNANKVSRSVYNFWNVIGDVGGFYGVLVSACASIISVLTYQKSTNHISTQLFLAQKSIDSNPNQIKTRTRLIAQN